MSFPENSSRPAAQQKPVTGHDSVLRAIQNQGRTVYVQLISGEIRQGILVGRDKYTITVRVEDGTRRVIYKHAIEEFWAEEKTGV